jgi:phage shock protein PspC (stress-responsive transcriptional regulator)
MAINQDDHMYLRLQADLTTEEETNPKNQLQINPQVVQVLFIFLGIANWGLWVLIWYLIQASIPDVLSTPQNFFLALVVCLMLHLIVWQFGRVNRHFLSKAALLTFYLPAVIFPGLYHYGSSALPDGWYPMLSGSGLSDMQPMGWVVLFAAISLIGGLAIYHMRLLRMEPPVVYQPYLALLVGLLIFIGIIAGVGATWDYSLHLHHYIWSFLLANFARFDTRVSAVCQGLLFAILTQEMSSLGALSFYDAPILSQNNNSTVNN